jgi:DNA-binding MarR family transcriptional regulator
MRFGPWRRASVHAFFGRRHQTECLNRQGINMSRLEPDEAKTANAMRAGLEEFRKLHSLFPIQQIMVLLTVALRSEPITLSELCVALDVAQSTASKNLIFLSDMLGRKEEFRYGFVRFSKDPGDYRKNNISLTPKGRAFVSKVLTAG